MYKLRPYQLKAVDLTAQHFKNHRAPAVIVLPTGAGKSLVIAELAKRAKGRVLVLAHVRELVEQNFEKYQSYELEDSLKAGIYSAGLHRKDCLEKVIFGSIQSVARANPQFLKDFSLLIIDEAHRVSDDKESQYQTVIKKLYKNNPKICALGLTATPYRLGLGWIYNFSYKNIIRTEEPRFFKKCIFEQSLLEMIKEGYLTQPVKINSPTTAYDFSDLVTYSENIPNKEFSKDGIEEILKKQKKITPLIIKNIIELSEGREGTLIYTASISHAKEVLSFLPKEESEIITGTTPLDERDEIISKLKSKQLKFLVNVSVLTTGFDAPHIDVIAILRPTESTSLYQQIIGRGLRISPGKKDCLILDYTGMNYSIFNPEILEKAPNKDSVPVKITCPKCAHINDFWGIVDLDGDVIEHYGRKCRGAKEDPVNLSPVPCNYRFRFKFCQSCGAENDIAAKECLECTALLIDSKAALQEARASKEAHVMRVDSMHFEESTDKKGRPRLEIRYCDADGQHLSEYFYLTNTMGQKAFHYNFIRMHSKRPEKKFTCQSFQDAFLLQKENKLRVPEFVIAKKNSFTKGSKKFKSFSSNKFYWKVEEKVFSLSND